MAGFTKNIERLDYRMVARYKRWVDLGNPEEMWEDAALSVHTPQKMKCANESSETLTPTPVEPAQQPQMSSTPIVLPISKESTPQSFDAGCDYELAQVGRKLGPMPTLMVPGKVWVV